MLLLLLLRINLSAKASATPQSGLWSYQPLPWQAMNCRASMELPLICWLGHVSIDLIDVTSVAVKFTDCGNEIHRGSRSSNITCCFQTKLNQPVSE
jgi:hypothetical protein